MMGYISDCAIWPGFLTDHSFIYIETSFDAEIRGRGFWKFNTKILEEIDYVQEINKIIQMAEWRYQELDPGLRWETLKNDVREFMLEYSKQRASKNKREIEQLEKQLQSAHKKLAMINLKSAHAVRYIEAVNTKIDKINEALGKHSLHVVQGQIIRSKARYVAEGEHSTKYFFSLEKRNTQAKVMNKIKMENGKIVEKPGEILRAQADFYQKLYTSNPQTECKISIDPEQILTQQDRDWLEEEITIEEIQNVIKEMALNKSPGTDGFQVNFYIVFFTQLKEMLFEAFQYAVESG